MLRGRPLTYAIAVRRLRNLCERVGLRQVHWHALRHTFASTLAMRGAPVNVIQGLFGHESVTTTMRYAHVFAPALAEAVKALEGCARLPKEGNGAEPATAMDVEAQKPSLLDRHGNAPVSLQR